MAKKNPDDRQQAEKQYEESCCLCGGLQSWNTHFVFWLAQQAAVSSRCGNIYTFGIRSRAVFSQHLEEHFANNDEDET